MIAGLLPTAAHADPTAPTSKTFNYVSPTGGAQTWTVPAGVTSATFDVFGAQGGNAVETVVDQSANWAGLCSCDGALGGETTLTLPVTPGQTFQINVGEADGSIPLNVNTAFYHGSYGSGGFNGGGIGGRFADNNGNDGGGGGGASDVRAGAFGLDDRVVVAGGGGGAAGNGRHGSADGGSVGMAGKGQSPNVSGGGPGTQVGGGAGGVSNCGPSTPGSPGTKGQGGAGNNGGGGGGGGYFGGGGGGDCMIASGGGGGSSYSSVAGATFHTGVQSGNGQVTITYMAGSAATTAVAANQQLNGNLALISSNGAYTLQLQANGNLVKTRQSDNTVVWMSHSAGTGSTYALMQSDGNFVLYDSKGSPQWWTGTSGNPGAQLVLHDDGNLVVVHPNGTVLWLKLPTGLQANQTLTRDHSLVSPAGAYSLLMQDDGNLVEYRQTDNAAIWSTGSNGPAAHATFLSNGDFTVTDDSGKVYWDANSSCWCLQSWGGYSWGYGSGEQLVLHDDGTLAVVDGSGTIKWSTKPSS